MRSAQPMLDYEPSQDDPADDDRTRLVPLIRVLNRYFMHLQLTDDEPPVESCQIARGR